MAKTIIVCGHGSGISDAVARKFGEQGFQVALAARNADRLTAAAAAFAEAKITARAFPCDLGDPAAVRALVREVRASLGPVTVLHWNAYSGAAGDLTTAPTDELRAVFDVSIHGLIAGVQEALPDLTQEKGAVLVTGGGLGSYDPNVDAMAVQWGAMGLALAKAAQHKTVGLLHQKLAPAGIHVGEVTVLASVKGTSFDSGQATLEASAVAEKFWEMYQSRSQVWTSVS
ncbi:MAG TPA: SDR family NAD(P)-dependent oxidoreductase [Candidatus Nanopelagicales bacterium]|nr:SDR family NAD(P)-dependent oxidoreductase [Candidatus Nanopelagicales bacterium]